MSRTRDPDATQEMRTAEGRTQRLQEGVSRLRTRTRGIDTERAQLIVGGVLGGLGFLVILIGWYGAANTPYVFEQIPYMISGGLLGLGLLFVGGFVYFAYWVGRLVREERSRAEGTERALSRIEELLWADLAEGDGQTKSRARKAASNGAVFVATEHGSMFHRDDCPVVADRDVRQVSEHADLEPCRICDPLDEG